MQNNAQKVQNLTSRSLKIFIPVTQDQLHKCTNGESVIPQYSNVTLTL